MQPNRKQVGFRRDIKSDWFDMAAALRVGTPDVDALRAALDDRLAPEIVGPENRAITVQILLRIWAKPDPVYAALHAEAVARYAAVESPPDRVWLHYGLCLLAYPFFHDAVGAVGGVLDRVGAVSTSALKRRIVADMGPLGSLENAAKAVMYALRQWRIVRPAERRGAYVATARLATSDRSLESWLLSAALSANEADALPVDDLFRSPALFPFQLSLSAPELACRPDLDLIRLGGHIDMLHPVEVPSPHRPPAASPV